MKVVGLVSILLNIILILFILGSIFIPSISGWLFNKNPEGFFEGVESSWGVTIDGVYVDQKDGTYSLVPRPYSGDGLKDPLPIKTRKID